MRIRIAAAAVALAAAVQSGAPAQEYATPSPVVRSTELPVLQQQARDREIKERFAAGIAAETSGNYTDAIAEFERILALHPKEPQFSTARYDLGIAYAKANRLDEAATRFRLALQTDPGFLAAMANLIAVDLALGDVREARDYADRFVRIAPESARALYSRGLVAIRQNDLKTARSDFSQLLSNDPQYAVAHYDLGVIEARSQQWSSAEKEFALALDIAPTYARARFALGTVLLREGRKAEARAAFDRVVHDANGDVALQNLAVEMQSQLKQP